MFSRVVLHGRQFGPPGPPLAFKTQFGWVLTGTVCHANRRKCYHLAITGTGPRDKSRPHNRKLKAILALAGSMLAPERFRRPSAQNS